MYFQCANALHVWKSRLGTGFGLIPVPWFVWKIISSPTHPASCMVYAGTLVCVLCKWCDGCELSLASACQTFGLILVREPQGGFDHSGFEHGVQA